MSKLKLLCKNCLTLNQVDIIIVCYWDNEFVNWCSSLNQYCQSGVFQCFLLLLYQLLQQLAPYERILVVPCRRPFLPHLSVAPHDRLDPLFTLIPSLLPTTSSQRSVSTEYMRLIFTCFVVMLKFRHPLINYFPVFLTYILNHTKWRQELNWITSISIGKHLVSVQF